MRPRNTATLAVFGAIALAATGAAADDTVIVLEDGGGPGILWRTDSQAAPNALYVIPLGGFEQDEHVLAIDTLAGFGHLYGLTEKRLYRINPVDGQATAVGPRFAKAPFPVILEPYRSPDLEFDPASGLGLVVGATAGVVASVDPLSGRWTELPAAADDQASFVYADDDPGFGETPDIRGVACAGNIDGANAWTMFGVDRKRGTLVRVGSVGGLQVATDDRRVLTTVASITGVADGARPAALEVSSSGDGYVVTEESGGSVEVGVYQIDLATGVATLIRADHGFGVRDAAVLPSLWPEPPLELDVTKAVVRFDFRPSRTDAGTMIVTGTLPYPADGLAGRTISVDLDGVVREFTTDAKGRARSGTDRFRFVGKLNAGRIRYEITIRKADLGEVAGVNSATPTGPRAMTLDLFMDDRAYRATVDVDYFAGRRRGVAKTP